EGNLMSLNDLVHELNRLEEGETLRFFNERFYLDRFIDRAALCAIRGETDRSSALNFFLQDSRNGKWELLQETHRSGDWGIHDFEAKGRKVSPEDATRMLLGESSGTQEARSGHRSVLEARFFSQKELRIRFLDRVESLLSTELAPAKFEALV